MPNIRRGEVWQSKADLTAQSLYAGTRFADVAAGLSLRQGQSPMTGLAGAGQNALRPSPLSQATAPPQEPQCGGRLTHPLLQTKTLRGQAQVLGYTVPAVKLIRRRAVLTSAQLKEVEESVEL